jgi:hypothetical protein
MPGNITFLGDPPFRLPNAQTATAVGEGSHVRMFVNCILPRPHSDGRPESVSVELIPSVALELARQLVNAVEAADAYDGRLR